ncbi:MAG: PQQ-binding-like beta-propeller repeat protein [Bacteroidota bacterium]
MKKTLNKLILSGLLFLLFSCAGLPPHIVQPLTNPVDILSVPTGLENSMKRGTRLQGTKYVVPFDIVNYLIDKNKMQICLIVKDHEKTRDPQYILINYDLNKNHVLWARKTYVSEIKYKDNELLVKGFRKSWKSFGIDRLTGDVKWQNENGWSTPLKDNVAVFSYPGFSNVKGLDANTNQTLWTRSKVKNEFGWLSYMIVGDDLLAVIDGLHKFNIKTGEGWSIELKTGKYDNAKAIGLNIASGLLGGGYIPPDKITGLASNLLMKNDRVYLSASRDLFCIDFQTGKEMWHTKLDERKTGEAVLFSDHDKLILINKGNSYRNGNYQKYGQPSIGIYDILTGEQVSFSEMDVASPIKNVYNTKGDGFYLLTAENLLFYDNKGSLKCKFGSNSQETDQPKNIAFPNGNALFTLDQSNKEIYQSLSDIKNDSMLVLAQATNGFSIYNSQCSLSRSIANETVNRLFAKAGDMYFLDDILVVQPGKKNLNDINLKILTPDKKLFGSYNIPRYAEDRCVAFVSDSTKTYLFYLNDINSFVVFPIQYKQPN